MTLSDVTDVRFSDETLVRVERTGDDWKLISLRPFDTQETLTIDTVNGPIEIQVTDAVSATDVCKIGNNGYATLEAAVAVANDSANTTITLLKDCTVNSPITYTGGNNAAHTRTLTIEGENFTINRGSTTDALFTVTSGTIYFKNLSIDGKGDVTPAGGSLIRMAAGNLNLTNVTVRNHKANAAEVCAVDVSNGAIYFRGLVSITGNMDGNGSPANLDLGTRQINFPENHTGTVGVTSSTHSGNGDQISSGNAMPAARTVGTFTNDKDATLTGGLIERRVRWIGKDEILQVGANYYYKGIIYTVTGTNATATGMYLSDAEIVSTFPYESQTFKVTRINNFNPEGKKLALEDALVDRMYPDDMLIHALVPNCPDEDALNASSTSGATNDTSTYEMWKKAVYNSETNSVEITLDYFQRLREAPVDFIIIADESATTYNLKSSGDITNAPIALWERAAMRKMAKALLTANETEGYDNRIAFVVSGELSNNDDTAYASGYFSTYDSSVIDWVSGNYLHNAGVTRYAVGQAKVLQLVQESRNANPARKPVVIYMTDFHQGGTANATTRDQIQNLADVYAVSMFGYDPATAGGRNSIRSVAGSRAEMYLLKEDPGELTDILTNIIEDAIGYYIESTSITDALSVPMQGPAASATVTGKDGGTAVTPSKSGTTWTFPGGDRIVISGGNISWVFPDRPEGSETEVRMSSGIHYARTISIPLSSSDVYSGAVATNGDCDLEKDGTEENKIAGDDFPKLSKSLTLVKVD